MSNVTTRLGLPFLQAAQSQKHVTHGEGLLGLDALVHLVVLERDRDAPPATPADGDAYLVGGAPTDAWAGQPYKVAAWQDGAWRFYAPRAGYRLYDLATRELLAFEGAGWARIAGAAGQSATLARAPFGAGLEAWTVEEEVALAGASVASIATFPNRAIVLGASTRTIAAVTGATSYDCGFAGEPSKFGGALGAAEGASNVGVIGPQAIYADTGVVLTANGGDFTGGAVRIALHYLLPTAPTG